MSGDLTPEAVELLHVVSEPLRVEMHFEMYAGQLKVHPFFAQYMEEYPQSMRRICHCAMSTLLMDPGDVIFSEGEVPAQPKMYFVNKGRLAYNKSEWGLYKDPQTIAEKQSVS